MINIALSLSEPDGGFLNVVTMFFRHWGLYYENDSFVLSCLFFKNIVRDQPRITSEGSTTLLDVNLRVVWGHGKSQLTARIPRGRGEGMSENINSIALAL